MSRPESERSPTTLAHEVARCQRMANLFESEVPAPLMQGAPTMAHLVLAVALAFARDRCFGDLTDNRPQLAAWLARVHDLRSRRATAARV